MGTPPPYHHEGQHVLSQRCMGGGSTTHWHRGMNALWPAAGKPRSTDLDHTCQSDRTAGKFGDLMISDLDFRLPLCHQNCQLASYIAGHVAAFWLAGCMGWQVFIVITWTGSTSLLEIVSLLSDCGAPCIFVDMMALNTAVNFAWLFSHTSTCLTGQQLTILHTMQLRHTFENQNHQLSSHRIWQSVFDNFAKFNGCQFAKYSHYS